MESSLIETPAALPVAPYLGGKKNLAKRIVERIRSIPHRIYVEPFVGMAGVFLRRPFRAPAEVINDISADVATLFRVLQRHYVPLMDMLRWQLTSRAGFARLLAAAPDTLTDLERAARFLYLQRCAFGGKVAGRNFGVSASRPGRFDVTKLASLLESAHERLAGVTIERLPWLDLLDRYDRPETLFYCDPPYWGCEDDYGAGIWGRSDFELLAAHLRGLKGTWLLSLNDRAEVRRLFRGCHLETVRVSYGVGTKPGSRAPRGELIISP